MEDSIEIVAGIVNVAMRLLHVPGGIVTVDVALTMVPMVTLGRVTVPVRLLAKLLTPLGGALMKLILLVVDCGLFVR